MSTPFISYVLDPNQDKLLNLIIRNWNNKSVFDSLPNRVNYQTHFYCSSYDLAGLQFYLG